MNEDMLIELNILYKDLSKVSDYEFKKRHPEIYNTFLDNFIEKYVLIKLFLMKGVTGLGYNGSSLMTDIIINFNYISASNYNDLLFNIISEDSLDLYCYNINKKYFSLVSVLDNRNKKEYNKIINNYKEFNYIINKK